MGTKIQQVYGVGGPLVPVMPPPILAQRSPVNGVDVNYPQGQVWFDNSQSPPVSYEYVDGSSGTWETGGNAEATTTSFGTVQLATLSELENGNAPAGAIVPLSNDVATVIQSIVVGVVPPATETQKGIAEIATQAETDAGVDDTRIVTPLKLANFVGSGGVPGSFTDLTATGTVTFTGATGALSMTSTSASSLGVTGAGIDLTLSSAAGRVVVNGEEAAADAVRILSAAGGLDANVALQMNLDSSQVAATAVRIVASDAAGGIDVDAGTGGITIDSTGVISIDAAAASNFTVTGAFDNTFSSTAGSINISGGEAAADAINIDAAAGGVDVDAALQINIDSSQAANNAIRVISSAVTGGIDVDSGTGGIAVDSTGAISIDAAAASNFTTTGAGIDLTLSSVLGSVLVSSTENAALAIRLHANGGTSETIQIHADQGTGVASLDLLSDAGGITLRAGLGTADAINITATDVGGGIDIDSGTAGFIVDTTGAISLDSALASNLTVTGVADLTLSSVGGSVIVTGTEAAVDAIQLNATTALGGIDINAGTGGMTVDSGGLLSLDAAGIVNLTTTGAFDITVNSTAGSVILTGAEAAVDAIQLNAVTAGGGIDMNAGSGGVTVDTTAAISLDSATASNFTVTGAADLTLQSTAGAVNVISGEANADSINVTSAGGMNVVATGAAAKDTIITNTNGSMTLTAGENVTDAMNFTASGAASRINLTAGTGSINLASGLIIATTDVVFADSPYTVLGTDYFLSVDTSAGAVTVTLPNAATLAGRTYVIRDTGGAAAATNITVATAGGNLVGGGASAATKTISAAYAGATVYSNGTTWNYCYVA